MKSSLSLPIYVCYDLSQSCSAKVIIGGLSKDECSRQRDASPMAGASTAYHNVTLIAKRKIVAGEELFVSRGHDVWPHVIPSHETFKRADEIVAGLYESREDLQLTEAQWVDVLYRIQHELLPPEDKHVAALLPKTFEDLMHAGVNGTAKLHTTPFQDIEWIKRYGKTDVGCRPTSNRHAHVRIRNLSGRCS